MRKILHIQVLPKLAGAQRASLEILKALPNEEYEKWILFSDTIDCGDKRECIRQFEAIGAKVIFSKKLRREICLQDIAATRELYKLCKREKFDIVHTNSTKPGIIGRIAATLAKAPLVIHTVHGLAFHKYVSFPKWQFYWMCEMFASMFCDRIVLVNKFYQKYFKWQQKKTTTIYNGIDFSRFSVPKESKAHSRKDIKILFVGRLETPKDPLTLLEAAQIVIKQHPEARFTLVGDGDLYSDCRSYIKENHLENNISMTGWLNNVAKYYQTYDIFALSSIYESFGLIFLEAGYYHLPTVATNVEGIPEVVADGETGLLCNPRDPETLAKNIIYLIEHPEERKRIGDNAYNRVTSLFTSEKMVKSYKQLYEKELNIR